MNWINTEQELPPYDGYYEGKIGEWSISTYIYDGIGFFIKKFLTLEMFMFIQLIGVILKKKRKNTVKLSK